MARSRTKKRIYSIIPKNLFMFLGIILLCNINGNSQEHALGINTGFSRLLFNNAAPDYNLITYGIQYIYYTPKNIMVGGGCFQGHNEHVYLLVIDPFIGYRFNFSGKINPEVGLLSGLAVVSYGEIPNFWYNIGGKAGITMTFTKYFNTEVNYQLLGTYTGGRYNGIIDQIRIQCTFIIKS